MREAKTNGIEVKSGRRRFLCTSKDKIMDNGHCYQVITQKYQEHFFWVTPKLSKTEFQRLKKLNVLSEPYKQIAPGGYEVTIYNFVIGENA